MSLFSIALRELRTRTKLECNFKIGTLISKTLTHFFSPHANIINVAISFSLLSLGKGELLSLLNLIQCLLNTACK